MAHSYPRERAALSSARSSMRFDWDTVRGNNQRSPQQALETLFHKGTSDTQIAAILTAEFLYNVSRSSVIGRRHRSELTDDVRATGPMSASAPFSPKKREAAKKARPGPERGSTYVSAAMVEKRAELVEAGEMRRRRDFSLDRCTEGTDFSCDPVAGVTALLPGDCRWPMDAGGFCANPAVKYDGQEELSPYCRYHYVVAYRDPPTRRANPRWADEGRQHRRWK